MNAATRITQWKRLVTQVCAQSGPKHACAWLVCIVAACAQLLGLAACGGGEEIALEPKTVDEIKAEMTPEERQRYEENERRLQQMGNQIGGPAFGQFEMEPAQQGPPPGQQQGRRR